MYIWLVHFPWGWAGWRSCATWVVSTRLFEVPNVNVSPGLHRHLAAIRSFNGYLLELCSHWTHYVRLLACTQTRKEYSIFALSERVERERAIFALSERVEREREPFSLCPRESREREPFSLCPRESRERERESREIEKDTCVYWERESERERYREKEREKSKILETAIQRQIILEFSSARVNTVPN
jgi:hypothetical protein